MTKVADVFLKITTNPLIVNQDDKINSVHEKLVHGNPISRCVYVVDKQLKLVGKITLQDMLKVTAVKKGITGNKHFSVRQLFEYISKDLKARDIMTAPVSIKLNEKIEEALQKMINHNVEEIAVVDDSGEIIGDLNAYELINECMEPA